jgi:hypothetical protein
MVKIGKYFRMMFLIAQIKRFGTLNATQKNRSSLQSTVLKKNKEKLSEIGLFNKKCIFDSF